MVLASLPAARGQGAKPAAFPEPNQYDPGPASVQNALNVNVRTG